MTVIHNGLNFGLGFNSNLSKYVGLNIGILVNMLPNYTGPRDSLSNIKGNYAVVFFEIGSRLQYYFEHLCPFIGVGYGIGIGSRKIYKKNDDDTIHKLYFDGGINFFIPIGSGPVTKYSIGFEVRYNLLFDDIFSLKNMDFFVDFGILFDAR